MSEKYVAKMPDIMEAIFDTCYRFVAKKPHACVWDESHIIKRIEINKIEVLNSGIEKHKINIREIDYTSISQDRNLPLMWSLDCLVIKVLTQIDLYLYSKV